MMRAVAMIGSPNIEPHSPKLFALTTQTPESSDWRRPAKSG